jgi:hypothetical protein
MRIRQVKPAYWADPLLQKKLTAAERECYIGLWMFADDSGWLRLDLAEIAGELYRYRATRAREAALGRHVAHLEGLGRIELYGCGHAFIPTLTKHQRMAAETRKVFTILDEHRERCQPEQASAAEGSGTQRSAARERKVEERNGGVPGARAAQPPTKVDEAEMITNLIKIANNSTTTDVVRSRVLGTLGRYGVESNKTFGGDDHGEGDEQFHRDSVRL